jgi:hypothetical protein
LRSIKLVGFSVGSLLGNAVGTLDGSCFDIGVDSRVGVRVRLSHGVLVGSLVTRYAGGLPFVGILVGSIVS